MPVAVGGVFDEFLLGQLEALGLAAAGLVDRAALFAAAALEVVFVHRHRSSGLKLAPRGVHQLLGALSSSSAAIIASRSQSTFAGHGFGGCSSSVFRPLPVIIATTVSSGSKRPRGGELLEHRDRRPAGRLGQQALGRRQQVDAREDLAGR